MWNLDASKGPEAEDPDRLKSWNSTNYEYGPGIFYFSLTWRQTFAPYSKGLSLYNFKMSRDSILSYKTNFIAAKSTYSTVSLEVKQKDVKIMYLAFSVILTQSSNYVYLISE